ncbi:MAG: energy transducer TonB [Algoriphagus sp.]|jgi:TonB family protein|nr:energy transducer TonB [Algoriphagus sp.]
MKSLSLLVSLLLFTISVFAQKTTSLNRHFYEIATKDPDKKVYSMTESKLASKEMLYLIFDNQNRKIKQIKVSYNEAEKFNQELTDTYDSAGNLISQTLLNLDNRKSLTLYFEKGVKKGQVIRHNYDRYEIWREGNPEPYELPYSDFLPGYEVEKWTAFLAKNLSYPMAARRSGISGTVYLALLISETGELLEYEVANEAIMDKNLVKEALRMVEEFKGNFKPALDVKGQPVKAWLYLPISFKLG